MPDPTSYCQRCDVLLGLPGLHVTGVHRDDAGLRVEVESRPPAVMGCATCGVVAHAHGRQRVELIDAACFTAPVRLWWRKRRWLCPEPSCPVTSFMEQDPDVARPRALLTARATSWAVGQMRRENASVQGLARQLGCAWRTLWRAVKPNLEAAAADESRFAGVTSLGVDEHIWHHVSTRPVEQGGRGPKEFTGMVDLTRDKDGRVRARLLDLVPGRSGEAYTSWLKVRGDTFREGVEIATLDPFHGYKNAIDDQLEDAIAVLDAFHVVKLGTAAVDEVRRRVQQDIHGHRGRKNDPLYRIRNLLRAGLEHLSDGQKTRLKTAFTADDRHVEVEVAWHCAQQLRSVYHQPSHADGRRVAEKILATFPSCPIPEIARLGRTLNQWRDAFLGYFTTSGANNGGTEAINGLIELARRIARGFRDPDNYRLRMLLIGGGLRL
ncbi:ISL3 family transposase [Tessaracoccus palaemonis]|uniref:ISL3 family transposase n=1 Tax=Tessaracoccus palaemonis TaxID=2829499 RepID=A0ABX8SE39_9ACTN|nr:ISL3 family transposase [Tessaracoccus palaemonis]QXT61641.1 ISL3 family transposase [Tessaracoccus palaemonis]QXT62464.1 ISL3 family transposase [Tessaracoccus palaemonis]